MATCSNCGFDLGNRPLVYCPRCRARISTLGSPLRDEDLPDAPAFGETEALASATLFGVPPQLDDEDTLLGDIGDGVPLAEAHSASDRVRVGETPPLGEVLDYSERALPVDDDDEDIELELDDPVPLSSRTGSPALELPLLQAGPRAEDSSLDLPLPVARSPRPSAAASGLDLPTPSKRGTGPGLPPPPPKRSGADRTAASTRPPSVPPPLRPPASTTGTVPPLPRVPSSLVPPVVPRPAGAPRTPSAPPLPSPSRTPSPPRPSSTSTGRHAALDVPAPARARAHAPAVELDLPTQARSTHGPSHARAPAVAELDLPTPARASSHGPARIELDLPTPAHADALRPTGKVSRRAPLPVPELEPEQDLTDVDLLEPVELDLPVPASQELVPRESQELTPAAQELDAARDAVALTPAAQELESIDAESLTPAALELEPRGSSSRAARARPIARSTGRHAPVPAASTERETAERAASEPRKVSRALLYGGAVLILLTAAGAGALASGVLDPWITGDPGSGAQSTRGTGPKTDASTAPHERSNAVLASFRTDTPASYRAALDEATRTGDAVGQAEAGLLLHLRYGPDLVRVGQARALLESVANDPQPFVRRVVGLAALGRSDHAAAASVLTDTTDHRTQLYRGFLEHAQEQHEAALATAEAVLRVDPAELAALELRHAARAARDPSAELAALEASVEAHPEHPGLRELLARTALTTGHLLLAQRHTATLDAGSEGESAGYRVRLATLAGHIEAARGDYRAAIQAFDRAITIDPNALEPALARARALVDAGDLPRASDTIEMLRNQHPQVIAVALLEIDVAIAGGDGDAALTRTGGLEAQEPQSAELAYRVGKVQAMRLQVDEASKAFATALARDPAFHRAIVAEAELLAAAHRPDDALQKLAAAIETHGDAPRVRAEIETTAAKILADEQRHAEAIAALDRALAAVPTSNEAQTLRGVLALRIGDTETGLRDLVAVFERTGGYPGVTGPLGRQFARERRIDELTRLVGSGAEDPQASIDTKLAGSRLALLQEDTAKARRLAEDVLSREPNNWEAHMLIAEAYRIERAYPEALEQIGQAKPAEPQAELHLLKGKILEFNRRHDEARPEYQKALAIDPSLHEARFLYGRSLAYNHGGRVAIEELTRVIEATGDRYPEAWASLGLAQKELGSYDQAIDSFAKAIALEPELYDAWFHKGVAHEYRHQYRDAAEAFEHAAVEATSTRDWYPDALIDLGRARVKLGEKPAAREALEKYLQVAPANHTGRAEAERLLRGL